MSDDQEVAKAVEKDKAQKAADAVNATRSGIGTRQFVGATRGKGSVVITFEQFDETKPETLPKSLTEFSDVAKISDEKELVSLLIEGYNDKLYKDASDPLAEFVNPTWDDDVKLQFRLVARNYAKAMELPLDEVAAQMRDAFNKKHSTPA